MRLRLEKGGTMPVSARGGRNHRGGPAAICGLLLALHGAPAMAQALPPLPAQSGAPISAADNPLVQRGVPAEATAENAVIARDQALINGQRVAYERLAAQLGLQRGLSDQQIEALVTSLVIEAERVTANRYTGRITVNFNPGRVQGAGGTLPPGTTVGTTASAPRPGGPTVATVDAVARYGSFREWAELNRRLAAAGPVARVQVVTISGDMARLRLALRSEPSVASGELAAGGVLLGPAPVGASEGWRVGLAGGR